MGQAITFYFDEIFPNYATWREFSAQTTAVGENPEPAILAFDKFCYNALFRSFAKRNIRYTSQATFCNMLATVYDQKFTQFYKQKQIIDAIYQLTTDDYVMVSQALSNIANNPNTEPADPLQPLQYISAQTVNHITENKLVAYMKALNAMPLLEIDKFIYGDRADPTQKYYLTFNDLFMQYIPDAEIIFNKGDNE